jgi:hypothetical protein
MQYDSKLNDIHLFLAVKSEVFAIFSLKITWQPYCRLAVREIQMLCKLLYGDTLIVLLTWWRDVA